MGSGASSARQREPVPPGFTLVGEPAVVFDYIEEKLRYADTPTIGAAMTLAQREEWMRDFGTFEEEEKESGGWLKFRTAARPSEGSSARIFVECVRSTWAAQHKLACDHPLLLSPEEGAEPHPRLGVPLLVLEWPDSENRAIEPMLIEHVGTEGDTFLRYLETASGAGLSERKILAVVQASGAGKTHLTTFHVGSADAFACAIIVATKVGPDRALVPPPACRLLVKLLDRLPADDAPKRATRRHWLRLDMVRLFTFAHIEWVLDVLDALKASGIDATSENASFFQDAALRCHRNGHGQDATLRYLQRAVVNTNGEHERVKKHMTVLCGRVTAYVHALGKRFHVAFDEVQELLTKVPIFMSKEEYLSGDDKDAAEERDLFSALVRHASHDLLGRSDFSVSICGTEFHIGQYMYIQQSEFSPTRGGLVSFTKVDVVGVEGMISSLQHYLGPVDISHEARTSLHRLRGRAYYFFYSFYSELWPLLLEDTETSRVNAIVINAATVAYEKAVSSMFKRLLTYWKMRDKAGISTGSSVASLLRSLYKSLRLRNGCLRARTADAVRALVTNSILVIPESDKPDAYELGVDLTDEPVAAEAIMKIGDDDVVRCSVEKDPLIVALTQELAGLDAGDDCRDRLAEDFLVWHLQRQALRLGRERSHTLQCVLHDLLPTGFDWPTALNGVVVNVSGCTHGVPGRSGRNIALEALKEHLTSHIVANVEHNMGANVVLPFALADAEGVAGVVAIQSKAKTKPTFFEALRSVELGRQFRVRNAKSDAEGKETHEHRHWASLLETVPAIKDHWVAATFSVRPWDAEFVRRVNAVNAEGTHTPLLLLQSSSKAFGAEAHKSLQLGGLSKAYGPKGREAEIVGRLRAALTRE